MARVMELGEHYRLVDRADDEAEEDVAGVFLHIEERASDALGAEIWIPAMKVKPSGMTTMPLTVVLELVRRAWSKKKKGSEKPVPAGAQPLGRAQANDRRFNHDRR